MRIAGMGVACVTVVALAGCSIGLTPAPTTPQPGPVECTDSYGPPVADTIGAVFFGLPATILFFGGIGDGDSDLAALGLVGFGLPTLLYILAARYGYRTAKRCFDAKDGNFRQPVDYGPEPAPDQPPLVAEEQAPETAEPAPETAEAEAAEAETAEAETETETAEPAPKKPAPRRPELKKPRPPADDGDLDADALFAELDADPTGASKTYWQKSLRVSGTVEIVDRGDGHTGLPYVTLVGKHPLRAVQCFFRDAAALAGLRKGARARLAGVFDSARVNVILLGCSIAAAEEPIR